MQIYANKTMGSFVQVGHKQQTATPEVGSSELRKVKKNPAHVIQKGHQLTDQKLSEIIAYCD